MGESKEPTAGSDRLPSWGNFRRPDSCSRLERYRSMKVIALVDGEHYPPVTRWGLASARAAGHEVVAAIVVGGVEKLQADGALDLGDIPTITARDGAHAALADAIAEHRPEAILDLSDEPVLGYERRMELVAVALAAGTPYLGPDFRFDPPVLDAPLPAPTMAVIGTGKRVSKTAIGGHVARLAAADGGRPVVVAMGRGGPPEPLVAGPEDVTLEALLERVERGEHAASDFLEDALTAGVPTVGARRCRGRTRRPPLCHQCRGGRRAGRRTGWRPGDPGREWGVSSHRPVGRGHPGRSGVRARASPHRLSGSPSLIAVGPLGVYHWSRSSDGDRQPFRSSSVSPSAPCRCPGRFRGTSAGAAGRREEQGCFLRNDRSA